MYLCWGTEPVVSISEEVSCEGAHEAQLRIRIATYCALQETHKRQSSRIKSLPESFLLSSSDPGKHACISTSLYFLPNQPAARDLSKSLPDGIPS